MNRGKFKQLFLVFFFVHSLGTAIGQGGLCPSNLDFETGDFTGWECKSWNLGSPGIITTGPVSGRHTIINATTAGVDPYGSFPEIAPNGSGFSMRLGNHATGSQAESVSYTYTIPSNLTVFSMLFYYAVVIESPGHTESNQPRFQARIIDVSTGASIPCVDFDFIANNTPGGFRTSPIPGNGNTPVLYKGWTPISVNLNAYIGKTIMLEFVTKDCSQGGHAGYAYVDVSTVCNGAISGTTICAGDESITLNAPFGFQSYSWYGDQSFSGVVSTNQTLVLNPLPPVGSIFPVIVEPFPGFGCKDTLYATISVASAPVVSVAGPDEAVCQSQQIQIGGASTPGYIYEWTPANLVSNPIISNPYAWNNSTSAKEFIVKTTDLLTGCFSYDTTYVATSTVDTVLTITGKTEFCIGDAAAPTLMLNSSSSNIRWFEGNNPIPGAIGISYQPTATGNYWAELSQLGCTDSTSIIPIGIRPLPLVSFIVDKDTSCITKSNFLFTNGSSAPDNSNMTYLWNFSDGNVLTTTDADITFATTGIYTIKLITTTEFGCIDSSTLKTVYVMPNGNPDFVWDSICVGRPLLFKNLSNENGSPVVGYNWNFNNGDPATTVKNPSPVIYTTPGKTDVTLKMVSLGCESDTQTIVKTVLVNKQPPGVRYKEITVPQGTSQFVHVRDSISKNFVWRPQIQLSNYTNRYTEFFATNSDVDYKIDMIDEHTCTTTDSMQILILRKPGYYLPTAFTPNGDGLNDIAIPYLIGMKSLKSFSVYNRWGNLIFYTATQNQGWDGKFKGVPQDSGVYVWVLEFVNSDDKKVTEKGNITIIR